MVNFHGYPVMHYFVTTDDGYQITLNRIPGPQGEKLSDSFKNVGKRQAILMMNGIFSNAQAFILNGKDEPHKSLPYQLADEGGFDVWIMSVRGTYTSRSHQFLDPDFDQDYWNFSFEEFGKNDLKACVDFILFKKPGHEQIKLLGYSQGTTAIFYALTEDPEYYNKRIQTYVALAPAIYFKNSEESMLRNMSKQQYLMTLLTQMGYLEFLGKGTAGEAELFGYLYEVCTQMPWLMTNKNACNQIMLRVQGKSIISTTTETQGSGDYIMSVNLKLTDPARMEIINEQRKIHPSGTSLKNLIHMSQLYNSGRFQKYDYGLMKNYEMYGSMDPPIIDISIIKVPTLLVSAENDKISDRIDDQKVRDSLPNLIDLIEIPDADHYSLVNGGNLSYFKAIIKKIK